MRNPYGKPLGGAPRAAGNSGSHRSTAALWPPIFEAIPVVMSAKSQFKNHRNRDQRNPAQVGATSREPACPLHH